MGTQDQSEQQEGGINQNATAKQSNKYSHSTDKWHTPKRKNFRGVNNRNKQQHLKQAPEQFLDSQVNKQQQTPGANPNTKISPSVAKDTGQEPIPRTTVTAAEIDGEKVHEQEIQTAHTSGYPNMVGCTISSHENDATGDHNRVDNIPSNSPNQSTQQPK